MRSFLFHLRHPYLGLITHYQIHDSLTFGITVLLGVLQIAVAAYCGYLGVLSLPADISKAKKIIHILAIATFGILICYLTIRVGVLNDEGQNRSDERTLQAEKSEGMMSNSLVSIRAELRQINIDMAKPNGVSSITTQNSASLQSRIKALENQISKVLDNAGEPNLEISSQKYLKPQPQLLSRPVSQQDSPKLTLNRLAALVEQIPNSQESFRSSLVHAYYMYDRFRPEELPNFLSQIHGIETNQTSAYLRLRTDIAEARRSALKQIGFSPQQASNDENTYKLLDKDASTNPAFPKTYEEAAIPIDESRFQRMSAYLKQLGDKIPT